MKIIASFKSAIKRIILNDRIRYNLSWGFLATAAGRSSGLFVSIILARILGKEEFGEFSIIQSTIIAFAVFAGFGSGLTATKHIAEKFRTEPSQAGRILGLVIVLSVVFGSAMACTLFFCAPIISASFLSSPHLSEYLRISSISLLAVSLGGAQCGALSGFEEFKALSRVNVFSGLANIVFMSIGVAVNGIPGALWGYNAAVFISCVFGAYELSKTSRSKGVVSDYKNCLIEWKVLWQYSLPTMLANMLITPVMWICNAMLVNQPNGFSEMAVYGVVTQWRILMLFIPGVVAQAILPIQSSQKLIQEQRMTQTSNLKMNLIIATPALIALSLLSPFIMGIYGKSYINHWPVFVVMQLAMFAQIIQTPYTTTWAATGRMWTNFIANILWGGTLVFFSWKLVEFGSLGLSFALLISFLFYFVIIFLFNRGKR